MRRPGIWVANGHPGDTVEMMYSWRPGAVTCIFDHLGPNQVHQYKQREPEAVIIVRFMHPQNWREDWRVSAFNWGNEIASKWNDLKPLAPYVYFGNEMNLHYESGDPDPGHQPLFETREFYQLYADWARMVAEVVKDKVPEMKLVTPPFAYGHHEDGAPGDDGQPTEGWAGYDYLADTITQYFDDVLCVHPYWGDAGGPIPARLYDPDLSSWHAFRWRRVLKLFEARYGIEARILIDECGSFGAGKPRFTNDAIYYSVECLKDPRVLALTHFLWMDPSNNPGSLPNSWTQQMEPDMLLLHVSALRDMPDVEVEEPEPPPEPEPEPLPEGDSYLRVVVDGAEVGRVAMDPPPGPSMLEVVLGGQKVGEVGFA